MRGIRKDQITFTRFIAAMAIVAWHCGSGAFPFDIAPISAISRKANVGVSYFFTLSGFIMILAYAASPRVETWTYYRSRFARIAPAYYVALVLALLTMPLSGLKFDFFELALNVTMLQAWVPSKALSVNPLGWSLSVEVLFYLLFPFLFNRIYRTRNLAIIAACGALLFIGSQLIHIVLLNSSFYQGYPSKSHDLVYYFPLLHLSEFIMGNIAGLFYMRFMATKSRANGPWIILSIISMLAVLAVPTGLSMHNGLLAVLFIPIILLITSDNGLFSRIMLWKPLVFLGEISYGIYILQLPIFYISYSLMRRIELSDPTTMFYLYSSILIVFSGLSFKFIETPLRNRINRINAQPGVIESSAPHT